MCSVPELDQLQCRRTALQSAQLVPAGVAYVAVHGTGTPLGDPIEVGALGAALGGKGGGGGSSGGDGLPAPLVIGSSKVTVRDGHSTQLDGLLLYLGRYSRYMELPSPGYEPATCI
jgi:Beta-ketoacyl synthase, C-terminal domain